MIAVPLSILAVCVVVVIRAWKRVSRQVPTSEYDETTPGLAGLVAGAAILMGIFCAGTAIEMLIDGL